MNLKSNKRLLYFIQLPPPIHGVSQINQQVIASTTINAPLRIEVVKINFATTINQLRKKNITKLYLAIILVIRLLNSLIRFKPHYVYFSFMPVGIGFYRDAFYLLLIKAFNAKSIIHLHNRGIKKHCKSAFNRWLYNKVFSNTSVIHLTKGLISSELGSLHLSNTQTYVVPNGVFFPPIPERDMREKKKQVNLLFFSNLIPEKGVFEAIKFTQEIIRENPEVKLNIAGADYKNSADRINTLIKTSPDLNNRILYNGSQYGDSKTSLFLQADIFLFPSRFEEECFPLVLLEAFAARLPVIAYDNGGINEIFTSGKEGFIVHNFDSQAFIEKLKLLITNSAMRIEMGQKARKLYEEKYQLNIFEDNMASTLRRITGNE